MRVVTGSWLVCLVVVSGMTTQVVFAQARPSKDSKTLAVGDVPVANVLKQLGAKLERGTTRRTLEDHSRLFDRTDTNRDGKHSTKEYVENGRYLTPQARSGIFRAADGNGDGVVTRAEYILNRIITDEAKRIVQGMDDDRDGRVERAEFLKHSTKLLSGKTLAGEVFSALDRNADDVILVPEYLRVWGKWARAGSSSAEKRIAAIRAEPADTTGKRTDPRRERPGGFGPSSGAGGRFGGGPPSPRQFVEHALRFDADKDGKLDLQELTKLAESLGRGRSGRESSDRRGRFGGRDSSSRPQRPAPERGDKKRTTDGP
ncbi:MAG: hypothetical protein VB861_06695 [Planctomycetaceae bacterium]